MHRGNGVSGDGALYPGDYEPVIDHFTREQFESALPKHKVTGEKLWGYVGLIQGEHVYLLPVRNSLSIVIRSSVHEDGASAETGEDSIRCWLIDPATQEPMAPKVARWVTRVKGWEKRLEDTLRYLYRLSNHITRCPKCGKWKKAKRVHKTGPNTGRVFLSCECRNAFDWLPDEFTRGRGKRAA